MCVIPNSFIGCCRTITPVYIVRLVIVCFIISSPGCLKAATIEGIKLIGGSGDYITKSSPNSYTLNCIVRNAYNDIIENIRWYKDGQVVYTWDRDSLIGQASSEFSPYVVVESNSNSKNIQFKSPPSFDVSGNYVCEVTSSEGVVKSGVFSLVVLDIPSEDFESKVSLMSDDGEELNFQNENANCTLLWDFKTPAIFPRPNVTCGYYSYLHDDVTNYVPAGLAMHLLSNGSWQAYFDHIHIQVSEIPREKRLGCSISIPQTSFKKIIKYQDNFDIDYLIDSEGCSGVFLDPMYRLNYTIEGGQVNCRKDVVPLSSQQFLTTKLRCAMNEVALFMNGSVLTSWSIELSCDSGSFQWRNLAQDATSQFDLENDLPICVPISNTGRKLEINLEMKFAVSVLFLFKIIFY